MLSLLMCVSVHIIMLSRSVRGKTGFLTEPSSSISYDGNDLFQAVTVDTGGTTLTPGGAYVILLTVSDPVDFDASTGTTVWGLISGHQPPAIGGGGGFVFFNNGNDFGALGTQVWDNFADFGDLAFIANFSGSSQAVPEPGALSAAGLGALVIAGYLRSRRRRHAA